MKLNEKEIEVVEILTGSYGLDYEFAKQIARLTFGDLEKAKAAADSFNIGGWSKEKVIDFLR